MTTTATTAVDRVLELANALVTRFDTNGDGQLSRDEFGTLLTRVLGADDAATRAPAAAAAGAAATPAAGATPAVAATTVAPRLYAPMSSFDTGKLNDPAHLTPKYIFARAWQDKGRAEVAALADESARKAYMEAFLTSLIPEFEKQGWRVLEVKNEKLRLEGGPGHEAAHWIDTVTDIEGVARGAWHYLRPQPGSSPA